VRNIVLFTLGLLASAQTSPQFETYFPSRWPFAIGCGMEYAFPHQGAWFPGLMNPEESGD